VAFPEDLSYTAEHEWVRSPGSEPGTVRVGITDYAQEALGDVVYVTLPEVGAEVTGGESCGELESTKTVNDLYAPVSGVVVARNEALETQPELVNAEPYDGGWMIEIRPSDTAQLDELLDADAYAAVAK
jgi:glycine cleavage system H protein